LRATLHRDNDSQDSRSNTADFAVIKSKNSSRLDRSCALAFTRKTPLNESKAL